jgi:peptidoglycan hydrolase-like protein with peptidoglycan-binding domain
VIFISLIKNFMKKYFAFILIFVFAVSLFSFKPAEASIWDNLMLQMQNLQEQASVLQNQMSALVLSAVKGNTTATQNTTPIQTTFAPTNPNGTVNKELTCPTPPGGTVWLLNMPANFEPNNGYWCNHASGGVVQYSAYSGGTGAGTFSVTTATAAIVKPTTTTTTTNTLPSNTVFSRTLKVGMSGDDVKALQLVLRTQGFLPASSVIDGNYGSVTAAAVKTYQATKGLKADGVAGMQTLQSILNIQINNTPILTTFAPTNSDGTVNHPINCSNGTSVTILHMPSNFEPNNDYWCSHCTGETVGGTIPCQYNTYYGGSGSGTFSATATAANIALKPTTTTTTTASTSTASAGVFTKSLKSGFVGSEVQVLQLALRLKGYLPTTTSIDGNYGETTMTAVKAFQAASGLVADGVAGMKTLQKLMFGSAI